MKQTACVKIGLEKMEMCKVDRGVARMGLPNWCFITGESERGGEKTSQRLESLLQSEDEGALGLTE